MMKYRSRMENCIRYQSVARKRLAFQADAQAAHVVFDDSCRLVSQQEKECRIEMVRFLSCVPCNHRLEAYATCLVAEVDGLPPAGFVEF